MMRKAALTTGLAFLTTGLAVAIALALESVVSTEPWIFGVITHAGRERFATILAIGGVTICTGINILMFFGIVWRARVPYVKMAVLSVSEAVFLIFSTPM